MMKCLWPLNAVINPTRAVAYFRIAFFQFNEDVLISVLIILLCPQFYSL